MRTEHISSPWFQPSGPVSYYRLCNADPKTWGDSPSSHQVLLPHDHTRWNETNKTSNVMSCIVICSRPGTPHHPVHHRVNHLFDVHCATNYHSGNTIDHLGLSLLYSSRSLPLHLPLWYNKIFAAPATPFSVSISSIAPSSCVQNSQLRRQNYTTSHSHKD